MKDRRIVSQVVCEQKQEKFRRSIRIYRQLKMIYRELIKSADGDEKNQILSEMKKIVNEAFYLYGSTRNKKIHMSKLDQVVFLFGTRLDEDELRLFGKECNPDEHCYIKIQDFKIAIEKQLSSFEFKPFQITNYVLNSFFRGHSDKKISITEFKSFITL